MQKDLEVPERRVLQLLLDHVAALHEHAGLCGFDLLESSLSIAIEIGQLQLKLQLEEADKNGYSS